MKNALSKSNVQAIVQQITNNTTSWIGHRHGETKNLIKGQTFTCPTAGELECIEVFSAFVTNNGPVDLTLHAFDSENKTWGPTLASSTVEFNRTDTGKWITFALHGLQLKQGAVYGFRLKSETGLIGVGEAASNFNHLPFVGGQEWMGDSGEQPGNYYTYFSLAFKVALRA